VEEAVLGAFWRNGYASTSLQDLCLATGLQHGSLYAAFGSKDAMFRRALDRYERWFAGEIATEARGVDAIEATFCAVVRLTVEDRARRGCPMINAVAEGKLSADARKVSEAGLERMRRLMRRFAKEASPDRPDTELDDIAAVLLAAMVAIRVMGRAGAAPALLHRIANGAGAAARAWCRNRSADT
jgi:TetR/AcrR family transcriptional regulator, transcriptional repressor for nem operon